MPIPTISKIRLSGDPYTAILSPDPYKPWSVAPDPWVITIEGYPLDGLTEEFKAFPDPESLFECNLSIEGLIIKSIDGKHPVQFHLKDYRIDHPFGGIAKVSLEILCIIKS